MADRGRHRYPAPREQELLAAEAGCQRSGCGGIAVHGNSIEQDVADAPQHQVACVVRMGVVDALEVVEVGNGHAEPAVLCAPLVACRIRMKC